jgi:hypothetical protein
MGTEAIAIPGLSVEREEVLIGLDEGISRARACDRHSTASPRRFTNRR